MLRGAERCHLRGQVAFARARLPAAAPRPSCSTLRRPATYSGDHSVQAPKDAFISTSAASTVSHAAFQCAVARSVLWDSERRLVVGRHEVGLHGFDERHRVGPLPQHDAAFAERLRYIYGAMVHCRANGDEPSGWDGKPMGKVMPPVKGYHDVAPIDTSKAWGDDEKWLRL